jgi:murein DD-endopeptidase MepM/ murein hydrolase activator NlpD
VLHHTLLSSVISRLALAVLVIAGCVRPVAPEPPAPAPAAPVLSVSEIVYFEDNPLMVPVDGVSPHELRDSFNAPRGEGRTHRALDIPAPRGTPIVAAIDGEVFRLRQGGAGGITAYLVDIDRRYVYYYAHLDHYADTVTEGLRVKQGAVIGYVGTSGNAPPNTPHLHFQVMRLARDQRDWWNGTAVDVRSFITKKGTVIQ